MFNTKSIILLFVKSQKQRKYNSIPSFYKTFIKKQPHLKGNRLKKSYKKPKIQPFKKKKRNKNRLFKKTPQNNQNIILTAKPPKHYLFEKQSRRIQPCRARSILPRQSIKRRFNVKRRKKYLIKNSTDLII